ncbi:unnamed protein product [Cylicocyclus nassatus]|uniref:Uncharacterized protein n=1 Tax=Cylicocyclus nassatus TaxID=53992 RepID=A0AA36GW92_CYLNA|nr:unnamed protein product [Cylicocyclus nassatus]
MVIRVVGLTLHMILTTLAIGCYNEYGENVAELYMSPHAPKSGLVTCMMEAALDPNTRTIRKMRMSGDMSERNETRILSVFYDKKSGTLQAKYTCQEEICNSVGAFMDALRKAEKKGKESVLLKFMLLGIERELSAASKRYDPEIIFVICAGITAAFAFFALLHMLTGLLLSRVKS